MLICMLTPRLFVCFWCVRVCALLLRSDKFARYPSPASQPDAQIPLHFPVKAERLAAAKYTAERSTLIRADHEGAVVPQEKLKADAPQNAHLDNDVASWTADDRHAHRLVKHRSWSDAQ